jgi:endonuclease/exonuclease/phosphatase family metal-dependent hydrolase
MPAPTTAARPSASICFQWIAEAGCPDVVTLQEVSDGSVPIIRAHLATACPFAYQETHFRRFGLDEQMILSRYPVATAERIDLYENFRSVTWARIDHPIGPVDVFTTHLASSSDGAQNPCDADCLPACVAAGAVTVRQCQGVQLAGVIADRHDVAPPALLMGDFNESPGTFVYDQIASRSWRDAYVAAGNAECDPPTGVGCTSGRADEDLSDLESPASNEHERIDYIFVVAPAPDSLCAGTLDSAGDLDEDGTTTRLFAEAPNPFAPTCGPAPDPICWPSDHEGVELDLNCS